MKRIFSLIFLILICFTSCQKGPYLSISGEKSHSFSAQGGTYGFSITSNRDWYVSISEPWCTVSPSSGVAGDGEIAVVITCEPNTAYDARSCALYINIEGAKESITIEQAAAEGLILSQSLYELPSAAQDIEVTVQANVEYTVTIDSQSEKWITRNSTKSLSSNKLTFSVFENTEYDERTGHITITQKDGNLKGEITIRQAQKDGLFVNTQDYVVSEDAQSLSVDVSANVQYEVMSEVEWINYVETKALKSSSVILNVGSNPSSFSRTGKVAIRQADGSLSSVINVTQQARPELKTENATEISFFGAKLNGRLAVESMAEITSDVWFLYSSSASSVEELKSDGAKVMSTLTDNGLFTKELSGLSMATTYNYVACAKVNDRDYYGNVNSFVTSDFSAEVTTKNATGVDFFSGQLNGSLSTQNADGFTKDVWFLYSHTSSSLDQLVAEGIKASSTLGDGGEFSAPLAELNYGTEYYFVACAKVHDRSFYGDVKSFTTSAFSASVTTESAFSDRMYKATVYGNVTFDNVGDFTKSAGFLYSEKSSTLDQLKEDSETVEVGINPTNGFNAELSGLKNGTLYYYTAWVKVYDKVFYGDVKSFTSYTVPEGAVDMGLSVAWGSCNIGASAPEESGDYFAWAEIETKSEFYWSNYKWGDPYKKTLNKYCSTAYYGIVDYRSVIEAEDDVASVTLGGRWRIPTNDELLELINNCTWDYMTYNGVKGYTATSKINGNKIFLPFNNEKSGEFWTASLQNESSAYVGAISETHVYTYASSERCKGLPVRAITE